MVAISPSGSSRETASNMRSEPLAWSGRVIRASPPARRTASQMASSSATTTTGPHLASTARRQTWTIMGSPAISASGLSGSLVAFSRAGMTMRLDAMTLR